MGMLKILNCAQCGKPIDATLRFRSFEYNGAIAAFRGQRICENCKKENDKNDRTRCDTK